MDGDSGVSFLALVHHNGEIKRRSREGVKFKSECPTNVFITSRTSFLDLQAIIVRKLSLDARKRVSHIYYRVSVAIVSTGVKYDCLSIDSDEDLQVLFHCRQQFPEMLWLRVQADPPRINSQFMWGRVMFLSPCVLRYPIVLHLHHLMLTYNRTMMMGMTWVTIVPSASLRLQWRERPNHPPQICHAVLDSMVEEALRGNDSNEETALIEGDSDDDEGTIPVARDGPSSSGSQQYPPHFSTLKLEVGFGVGLVGRGSGPSVHGSQGSHGSNVPGKNQIGQTFQTKEEALLALKNYNIYRGVEYRVLDSNHAKYHGK
ncbi:hypothetical protein PIB30_031432 [Stylosanthes scabra]|uniref:Uncharacterized protein n=1 Tax=Stylosanthes scabra TaxID=79078 RepID=A0ABU6RC24_9FABA|nr:hypothetical protein [Stylosanthes scabra]